MASSVTMKNKFTLKCKFYKNFWFFWEKIFSVVNNSYCHIKVSQVVMKQRGVFWSHVRIQCDIELMSPVWRSTIKKRPRWPWPLPEIIWPKSASMAKLIIILLEVKFFYKGFKLSCSGLTEISSFLERVLTEHRDSRVTSDSKLNKLLISSICSIRFLYRNWDVFDKPLQLNFNHTVEVLPKPDDFPKITMFSLPTNYPRKTLLPALDETPCYGRIQS